MRRLIITVRDDDGVGKFNIPFFKDASRTFTETEYENFDDFGHVMTTTVAALEQQLDDSNE